MRSFLKFILPVLAVWVLGINSAYAQLTAWRYSSTIDITENRGSAYTQYPILVYINTATLIANGQMQANGADMRFAQTCSGTNLLPYYIESGINTDSTRVWIRMAQINALNANSIYFFSGNAAAPVGSNFAAVFPNSFIASSNNTLGGTLNYDWFEIPAGDTVFVFPGGPLTINASRIKISGVINGNGAGYAGGSTYTNGSGPGGGNFSSGFNSGAGGGSYGGVGGTGGYDLGDSPGTGGSTYGTVSGNDLDMGSGGAGGGDVIGANGGGAVTLNGYDITISGTVSANGANAPTTSQQGGGGGSGGGLEAIGEHITVTGTVSAKGGAGSSGTNAVNDGGGGGGGGRIKAFYYANATLASLPSVSGGLGGPFGFAAGGTTGGVGSVSSQQLYGAFGINVHSLSLSHTAIITSGTDSACVNSTNTYTASNANSYTWRAVGGSVVSGQGSSSAGIKFTVAGTDSVVLVTTNAVGCYDTVKMAVIVNGTLPVAGFTVGGACTGLTTQFTDASTGPVTSYEWLFGDGGTSTDRNPTHTYATAGSYQATLTVFTAFGCSASLTKTVRVDNQPVADFTVTDGCRGSNTTFTNTSTGAATYLWEYGDGATSAAATPTSTHLYGATGTYDITLVATSTNGCKDSIMHQVTVSPAPTARFSAADVCNGSASQFVNGSTVASGVFSSSWTFGDGGTSTDVNPSHLYAGPGIYVAKLIVTSDHGCVDSISHLVKVNGNPAATFTQTSSTICFGDSVTFTAAPVVGTISYAWTFGDGATAATRIATHTYSSQGTFAVTLTVFDSTGSCSSTATGSVTVFAQPSASFLGASVCQGNATRFTNTSTVSPGTFSNLWSFGDATTSTDINPSHTYAAAGNYTVKLTITTNNGCQDTISHIVAVSQQPVANFSEVSSTVCDGVTVQFIDNSTATGSTGYHWYFGDGDSSNATAPSHTYAGPGTYNVVLNLIDSITGCSSSFTSKVEVFARPSAAFRGTDVCLHNATQFTNTSTISNGNITNNLWFLGDTTTSTDINPSHIYANIGIKTVVLVVTSDNGCNDTVSHTAVVYPLPVANFSPTTACFGQAVDFTNLTTIAFGGVLTSYSWDFGDGVTDTATNPSHTFPALGSYTVKLTAVSSFGCTNTVSKTVTIQPNPSPNFTVSNTCNGDSIHLVNLSSVSAGTVTSAWQFGDGNTSVSSNPTYSYSNSGTYTITLVATTNHGCTDSTTRTVTIYPTPNANFLSNDVCIGETTVFQSISTVTGGFISDHKWDFGDGNASVAVSPIHQYANPGTYVVSLTVTSNQGCKDSIHKAVIVHSLPDPTIIALGPVAFCMGDSVTLRAGVTGADHYLWSTGDTTQNITVKLSGLYGVTVTSQFGCKDSDAISVTAWALPIANAGNDTTISKGYLAHLHATGGVSYLWTPSDSTINDVTAQNPDVRPLVTTIYTVVVTDINGCKGTDSVQITVLEDYLVEATNVITPNNDGKNDRWVIVNIQTYPNCEVLIFDRLGNRVFESKAYHNEWDGKYNGKDLPEGTYYYVIKFDGNDRLYKGAVSILR